MRYPQVNNLSVDECWAQLRTMVVGRLAIGGQEFPELFPINYVVDRGTVMFRSDPGTKIAASLQKAPVAFEVDGFEPATKVAWSVVLKGALEPVLETAEILDAVALPLFPWQHGNKGFFVRVVPVEVSGRQFVVADPAHWVSQLMGVRRSAEE